MDWQFDSVKGHQEHSKMSDRLIKPKIFYNCFNKEQLQDIKTFIHDNNKFIPSVHEWEGEHHAKVFANRYFGNWNDHNLQKAVLEGLPESITKSFIVEYILHAQSLIPYEFHCDYGHIKCEPDETPFVIIIIPLETVNAKTIVLDQTFHGLHFVDYKEISLELPVEEQLTEEQYNEYFSHCWPQERPYISINTVFDWIEGNALVFDMKYIHASDNFLKNKLTEKNCISIFTKIKKNDLNEVYLEFCSE